MMKMEDLEKQVFSSNDWELLYLIHRELKEIVQESIDLLSQEKFEEFPIRILQAREILLELIVIAKKDIINQEIKENLLKIYLYINRLLVQGEIKKNKEPLENVIRVLRPLEEAFQEKSLEESARIVSGLTYGEKDLKEYKTRSSINFKG